MPPDYRSDPSSGRPNDTNVMFESSVRELLQRYAVWTKPPSREFMAQVLQREAERLRQPVKR